MKRLVPLSLLIALATLVSVNTAAAKTSTKPPTDRVAVVLDFPNDYAQDGQQMLVIAKITNHTWSPLKFRTLEVFWAFDNAPITRSWQFVLSDVTPNARYVDAQHSVLAVPTLQPGQTTAVTFKVTIPDRGDTSHGWYNPGASLICIKGWIRRVDATSYTGHRAVVSNRTCAGYSHK